MLHSVTSSILLSSFLRLPWISTANKVKLLEYKGRMDLVQYAARRAPELLPNEVTNYVPLQHNASDWSSVIARSNHIDDDGHTCKLVRALAHGQQISQPWEESDNYRVKGPMWLQLANMGI